MEEPPLSPADETSFGYQKVPRGAKAGMVRRVFDAVAPRYDLMNDLMSGGVHRLWKDAMIDWLAPRPGQRLLDVAGGTGDIARRFLARAARREGPPAEAVICDINEAMLRAGAERPASAPGAVRVVCGDAQALPIPDASVDAYTIAFGIRNVTDMDAALVEARRVLRPGGRFLCLEFSHPTTDGLQRLYDLFSFHAIPRIGAVVAGDRAAYEYLVESIRRFPDQAAFARRIVKAGFAKTDYRNLSGGIAAMHSAWRI
ncbi:MAG: class I SAM-dependent methyltransferase [Pseudomonadota bacterium]